jgi:hypothetical protein
VIAVLSSDCRKALRIVPREQPGVKSGDRSPSMQEPDAALPAPSDLVRCERVIHSRSRNCLSVRAGAVAAGLGLPRLCDAVGLDLDRGRRCRRLRSFC